MPGRTGWAALAALLTLAACSGGEAAVDPLPPPPSTRPQAPTSAPPDYRGVALVGATAGRVTTTTVAFGPGTSGIDGKVVGADGSPVESATVRIERMVGSTAASMDVVTGPDGTWSLPGVLGGAYRVRAWRVPDIAQAQPAQFFVPAGETVPLELKVERHFGTTPQPAVAPNPPVARAQANLVVQLSTRAVDPNGIVRATPMAGATVELAGGAGWSVGQPNPAVVDGAGRARWEVVCQAVGVQPLRLVVNGTEQFQLALPACAEPLTPLPATTGPTATSRPPSTTTSTRPGTTTTTTTRPVTTTTTTRATTSTTSRP